MYKKNGKEEQTVAIEYKTNVRKTIEKIDRELDNDYNLSPEAFDALVASRGLIEKMADEIMCAQGVYRMQGEG